MKKDIISLFLILTCWTAQGQEIEDIVKKPIDKATGEMEILMKDEIDKDVKLVGIGDVGVWVSESQKLNTRLLAYLVSSRNFRNIVVRQDAWALRPLDVYLKSDSPLDTLQIDALIERCISPLLRTLTFRDLLIWLKRYNLANANDMVHLYGVDATVFIPPAYLLATYVYPIDEAAGVRMSSAWGAASHSDSLAYSNVEQWLGQLDTASLSPAHKKLVSFCKQDILHNMIVKKLSSTQEMTSNSVQDCYSYIADGIIGSVNSNKNAKAIFFGLNADVARSNRQSAATSDQKQINNIGKFLDRKLKSSYYVSVVDYADSIKLNVINMQTRSTELVTLPGNQRAKQMILTNSVYFRRENRKLLADFVPTAVPIIKGQKDVLVYDTGIAPVDALFLFEDLSEGEPLRGQ